MWSECGARARNDTLRSRAASGNMLAGITTGLRDAFPGLGQEGAGNARCKNARFCTPVGAAYGIERPAKSQEAGWSCAGPKALTARAVVERR